MPLLFLFSRLSRKRRPWRWEEERQGAEGVGEVETDRVKGGLVLQNVVIGERGYCLVGEKVEGGDRGGELGLKDIPSFIRVTTLDDIMFDFLGSEARNCLRSSSIIINTFQDLDGEALDSLRATNPNIYTIGPLDLLGRHFPKKEKGFMSVGSSLWKNDSNCLTWLDKWEPNSVVYVNYGSITVMTSHHLKEFAWGLANSKLPFLWITRPDVVKGESVALPQDFFDEIKDRGYITSWCIQDQVLSHPSVGVFLTHCGWNSTLESVSSGVPMICWPFFAEQQTNARYLCRNWRIGMEINHDVKREEITKLVTEMMKGEKGMEIRQKSLEWKNKAIRATDVGGSSYNNFHKLIKDIFHKAI
ncbi:unnamed protein product [Sphenostylis stenocarpa]|uniref:UDP-glycosyltransferases domain-containing protein n=1 Tax=Sphenostylis stenocarpa TaxID=92480 RepID=A0AA86SQQ0_9FABA|nr:unnamed protein product [Sphenostylis stenocarpa]